MSARKDASRSPFYALNANSANDMTQQNFSRKCFQRFEALAAILFAVCLCGSATSDDALSDKKSTDFTESQMLTIGSLAPPLNIEHWLHGSVERDEVTELKNGNIYVIEFWATWCGPCVESIPHLAEIQRRYKDDKVRVISITCEELSVVKKFLDREYVPIKISTGDVKSDSDQQQSAPKTYAELTSNYCVAVDPDRSAEVDYTEAARQPYIPTAFLVGKNGHIEWIGHPEDIDQPLQQVIADQWDRDAFAKKYHPQHSFDMQLRDAYEIANEGNFEHAYELLNNLEMVVEDDSKSKVQACRHQIEVMNMQALAEKGLVDDAIEIADSAIARSTGIIQMNWRTKKFYILLSSRRDNDAAELLISLEKEGDVSSLIDMAFEVYGVKDPTPKLLAAAIAAAETSAKIMPEYTYTAAVLARLFYKNGELERAIDLQRRVVETIKRNRLAHIEFLKQLELEKSAAEQRRSTD